jgi:hypothetical protein
LAPPLLVAILSALPCLAQQPYYIEGEDYAGRRTPAWAPQSSGPLADVPWEGCSGNRVVALGEGPAEAFVVYPIPAGAVPPGGYTVWLRMLAGTEKSGAAAVFGPLTDGKPVPEPVGSALVGTDSTAFRWKQLVRGDRPGVVTIAADRDHLLAVRRAGVQPVYLDCIALSPEGSDRAPQDDLPASSAYVPRVRPGVAAGEPPADPLPDADLRRYRMRPVPARSGEASVSMRVASSGLPGLPAVSADAPCLRVELRLVVGAALDLVPTDGVVLRFRELFSGTRAQVRLPLGVAAGAGTTQLQRLEVRPEQAVLRPGFYLVTADVARGDESLCGGRVGAAEFYVCGDRESRAHATLSFAAGHASFSSDRRFGGHISDVRPLIPSTFDPADDGTWHEWLRLHAADTAKPLEGLCEGDFGLLQCAKVFRALGETDRATFVEGMLASDLTYMLDRMVQDDGAVHCCRDELETEWPDLAQPDGLSTRQDDVPAWDAMLLTLAAQVVLCLNDLPGSSELLGEVRTRGDLVAQHLRSITWLPCQGCTLNDGRVLSGLAWWLLARAGAGGQPGPNDQVEGMLRGCRSAAMQALLYHGWYDRGCLADAGSHIGYATQNLIGALQPAWAVAARTGRRDDAALFRAALGALYGFLAQDNAVTTQAVLWTPQAHTLATNGEMYVLCSRFALDVADTDAVRAYRDGLATSVRAYAADGEGGMPRWRSLNALASLAYTCPEYRAWEWRKGPLLF